MENNTLSHLCSDGSCHCDFRLSIYHCDESEKLFQLVLVALIMASINSAIGMGIVLHRLVYQSQTVFNKQSSVRRRFFLRPRPIDTIFFFTTVFSSLWVIDFTVLLVDILPSNYTIRSCLFDLPLQLCTDTCSLYMLSLLQRFSQTEIIHPNEKNQGGWRWWWWWFASTDQGMVVNLLWLEYFCGHMLLVFPFIANNSLSLVIGILSDQGQIKLAEWVTRVHFGLWTLTAFSVWSLFIYSTKRLDQIHPASLRIHATRSVQLSFYRNKIFLTILNYCSGLFVLLFFFYSLFRSVILQNSSLLMLYCACWIYIPLLTQLALQVAYIFHPQSLMLYLLKVKQDAMDDMAEQQQHQQLHDNRNQTDHTYISQVTSSLKPPSIASDIYQNTTV
ncbi:hypothetical protein BC941DRAFT_436844 [Chlamydoabsidia padenii]|nr:hypothetical protein BC941DRAFT_436844 [Chlamydoabsidia padenii]